MRMSEGVEWAAHCCLLLDWLGGTEPVPTAELAAAFEIPGPYLNKQLQALVRADILTSTRGKRGGFALARPLDRITLLDVVDAIEGTEPAFRCTEIRRCGIGAGAARAAFTTPCDVAASMHAAETAWRAALAARTLAAIQETAEHKAPSLGAKARRWYAERRG